METLKMYDNLCKIRCYYYNHFMFKLHEWVRLKNGRHKKKIRLFSCHNNLLKYLFAHRWQFISIKLSVLQLTHGHNCRWQFKQCGIACPWWMPKHELKTTALGENVWSASKKSLFFSSHVGWVNFTLAYLNLKLLSLLPLALRKLYQP